MLLSALNSNAPVIWHKTPDLVAICSEIIYYPVSKRSFYTLKPQGLSIYQDGEWKPVIQEEYNNFEGKFRLTTPSDLDHVLSYLYEQSELDSIPVLLIPLLGDASDFVGKLWNLFFNLKMNYREGFFTKELPLPYFQIVIISDSDCPEDYNYLFYNTSETIPSYEDIVIYSSIMQSNFGNNVFGESKPEEFVHACLGLTESAIISESLNLYVKDKVITPKIINDKKRKFLKSSGILEFKEPVMTFDSIGGLDRVKSLIEANLRLWNSPEEAQKRNIEPIRSILLIGVPGTGKSAICEATAKSMGLDLAKGGVSQTLNSFVGASESNMRAMFAQIKAMAPICVWIDEFGRDLSGGASSNVSDSGTTSRVHGEFLTGLQELPKNVFLMCAANDISELPPEMLRSGRFDQIFFVGLPTLEERIEIAQIYLQNSESVDPTAVANYTEGFTGAEIESLISKTRFNTYMHENRDMTTEDICKNAGEMKTTVFKTRPNMVRHMYSQAVQYWEFASSAQQKEANKIINNISYGNVSLERPNANAW